MSDIQLTVSREHRQALFSTDRNLATLLEQILIGLSLDVPSFRQASLARPALIPDSSPEGFVFRAGGFYPPAVPCRVVMRSERKSYLNQVFQAKVTEDLRAHPHERTDQRQGSRNGCKSRQLTTRFPYYRSS